LKESEDDIVSMKQQNSARANLTRYAGVKLLEALSFTFVAEE
jgi:hypothetical protein